MKVLEVLGVRVEMPNSSPVVLLREQDGERYLPIWIGAAEATAIAYVQQGVTPPRPLTHDLFATVITELGHTLVQVRIDALTQGVFHATLVFEGGKEISARSSDAIALALRLGVEVVTSEELLDEAGVEITPDEDDEVEKFKEFLDQVTPDDFDAPEEPESRG
ncbi:MULTISPECIES: bifunctional nuclease family protein [unclassified Janibacter]|uniref:bifunctional nuclease family protein n=1 Tax=unclassified Janibacter TaxID=2649294 RepID=UPI003D02490A